LVKEREKETLNVWGNFWTPCIGLQLGSLTAKHGEA